MDGQKIKADFDLQDKIYVRCCKGANPIKSFFKTKYVWNEIMVRYYIRG